MLISNASAAEIFNLKNTIEPRIVNEKTLEGAAQSFVEEIYHKFVESIILLRFFVTIQMGDLPQNIQAFANNLAKGAGITIPLPETSYALTLLGTVGENAAWNDRKKSKGHVAIPLASESFVSAIPMMSALLDQLGFDLGWVRGDQGIIAKRVGSLAGTFYVSDAKTTKDKKDRLIIAGHDFVKQYDVTTVYGIGGGYATGGKFITVICFTRDRFDKEHAIRFQPLVNIFKSKTSHLANDKKLLFK